MGLNPTCWPTPLPASMPCKYREAQRIREAQGRPERRMHMLIPESLEGRASGANHEPEHQGVSEGIRDGPCRRTHTSDQHTSAAKQWNEDKRASGAAMRGGHETPKMAQKSQSGELPERHPARLPATSGHKERPDLCLGPRRRRRYTHQRWEEQTTAAKPQMARCAHNAVWPRTQFDLGNLGGGAAMSANGPETNLPIERRVRYALQINLW